MIRGLQKIAIEALLITFFSPAFAFAETTLIGHSGSYTDSFVGANDLSRYNTAGPSQGYFVGAAVLQIADPSSNPQYLNSISYTVHGTTTSPILVPSNSGIWTYTDDSCTAGLVQYMNSAPPYFSTQSLSMTPTDVVTVVSTTTVTIPLTGVKCIVAFVTNSVASYYVKGSTDNMYMAFFGSADATSSTFVLRPDLEAPTIDTSACDIGISFSMSGCLAALFGWPTAAVGIELQHLHDNFFRIAPWGYITALVDDFSSTATSTIPALTIRMPNQVGDRVLGLGSTTIDIAGSMTAAAGILDTPSNEGDTIWSVFMPYFNAIVGLGLFLAIVADLMRLPEPEQKLKTVVVKK